MDIKVYKPYTPSRRFAIGYDFSDLSKKRPEKSLTTSFKKASGRNNAGRITSRFRGGGHKQLYRIVDFKGYDKAGIKATVASIEYDPYRTCRIALLNYVDGEKRYVLAWKGINVGDETLAGAEAPIKSGNRKQLKEIPEGIKVHNIEFTPMSKGKIVKSAGMSASIVGKDETLSLVFLKLPSGEVRKFNENCRATIGEIGNEQHKNVELGKAGRMRWLGRKPRQLGLVMNAVDHPHGGGEGHSPIGSKRGPKSFSGKVVTPGIKTRSRKKGSNRFIVSRRTRN